MAVLYTSTNKNLKFEYSRSHDSMIPVTHKCAVHICYCIHFDETIKKKTKKNSYILWNISYMRSSTKEIIGFMRLGYIFLPQRGKASSFPFMSTTNAECRNVDGGSPFISLIITMSRGEDHYWRKGAFFSFLLSFFTMLKLMKLAFFFFSTKCVEKSYSSGERHAHDKIRERFPC